ncbi:MAG: HNH endonuclease [Thaumarchaeota archaeon]|nr:HNH endonuclease [Nitrososphaerota archaeon]
MRKLFPSFAPPETWRDNPQIKKLDKQEWQKIRKQILERDNYTCQYCGYYSEKYQIVHHIDGNPENNSNENLVIICQMCNLVEHSGQGCVVQGVVDLYKRSKFSQNEIIQNTREMRDKGKTDHEIIEFLGLEEKVPFKMDREYLAKLYGFVTERLSQDLTGMYNRWKVYHKQKNQTK